MGPYCATPPSPTPDPLKQAGCPSCNTGSTGGNSGAADAGSGQTPKADPVNVSNANKYEAATDYAGVGSNPLKFSRTYNALSAYQLYSTGSPTGEQYMGAGWSATYFQYLLPVAVTDSTRTYHTVYAYRPDGRVLAFNLSAGVYSPDGDVADSLAPISGGWQYQTANDTIETYNTAGQLISVATRGQAPLAVNYASGSGLGDPPTSVSDPFGHSLTFSYAPDYNGVQRLASITDPAGKTIQYAYDSYGNLATVTNADGTTQGYGYNSVGYAGNHLLTSHTDEVSVQYATWGYSGAQATSAQLAGGVAAYTFSYSTSGAGGSVSATDPLGKQRTYNQSLIWGAYRTTSSSAACAGCSEDQSRVFDANGNITTRTDFNGNETTYVYDVTTNLETSRTEALTSSGGTTGRTRTITTSWNASYREPALISVYAGGSATGTPLRTTGFTYDGMGNMLTKTVTDPATSTSRTWTYTYDSYGRMKTAKGPRTDVDTTTTYAYYTCTTGYQCGQVQTITDALGHVTTYNTYNAHGEPLTITDANNVVTTLGYDTRLHLTSRSTAGELTSFSYWPTGLLRQVTLPDTSYVLYTYDGAHRLTQINDGLGNKIVYTLDAMGNRTAEKTYDPSSVLHRTHTRVINALNELYQDVNSAGTAAVTTTFGYDNNGNQTTINAPLARNTTDGYDELNRLAQITDPNSGVTKFGYDANDNLISVIDPRNLTTSYTPNGFGDVTKLVSPDTGTTNNTYDSGGNLQTATDARSAVASYTYDALNRVGTIAYKIGGTTDQTITFTYDTGTNGIGRLTGASDANHSMSWSYDGLGRVTGKGQVVGGVTRSIGYGYTNGDMTSLVTPSGQTVYYGYNTNHQITSISVNSTTVISAVTYEPLGPVNGWTWGNGTTTTRTYDQDQKITQISSQGLRTNTYDDAFRITKITNTTTGASTYTYGYDLLDRVTSGVGGVNQTFTYDGNGNRLTVGGSGSSTYSVSPTSNRVTAISGTQSKSYTYDAAGNPLTYSPVSLTYNDRGRLQTVQTTSNTETIVYNALGQMVKVSGGSPGTVLYAYDEAGHLIGEYSSTGALIEETVWLGDTPVATLRPHAGGGIDTYYVHTDHLNTPHLVTRPSDNLQIWRWFPPTFGDSLPNTNPRGAGTFTYNLRFPGQIYDSQAGLHQNVNRDYDPAVGRYVESDPIGLIGLHGINTDSARAQWMLLTSRTSGGPPMAGLPQTNPYTYGLDDPVAVIDPSGRFGVVGVVAIVATAVAAGVVIYSIYKCAQACDNPNVCPYPRDSGDPIVDQNRNAWVTGCKQQCVKSFGELGKLGPW